MKNLSLTFCLAIATLLASVGGGFALPKCPSGSSDVRWHNCFGTYKYESGMKYVGEWNENMPHGQGIMFYTNGTIEEGIWKHFQFQYAQKTPYSRKPSVLRNVFKKFSKENRKQIQSNLKDLGFYKSSIDGLYGRGTAVALTEYNKQNLNGAYLKKSKNVEKLFNVVLGLKPALKSKPDGKTKPKRDLEKEFGLSLYGSFVHSEKSQMHYSFLIILNKTTVLNSVKRCVITM
jgi:hypothetical protein